ncbi:MAG: hypothetical protein ACRCVQ_07565 [Acinetobacter ursingii]
MLASSESSWRHTPFRKFSIPNGRAIYCSWRHTPFRKIVTK